MERHSVSHSRLCPNLEKTHMKLVPKCQANISFKFDQAYDYFLPHMLYMYISYNLEQYVSI